MSSVGLDPAPADLADEESLWPVLEGVCLIHSDRVALHHQTSAGWQAVTYRRLADLVARFAARLRQQGLRHGDRIAIMGDTGLDWVVADLAALDIGAAVVPIYPTSSAEQVRHIVDATTPAVAVADTDDRQQLLSDAGIAAIVRDTASTSSAPAPGGGTADRDDAARPVTAADVATVVFTSGTTGAPKGCVLTHRNVFCGTANVAAAVHEIFTRPDGAGPRTVIALPLSHMYGRSTLVATLLAGGESVLIRHPAEMLAAMVHRPPTFLALTPYLLEKLEQAARDDEPESAAALSDLEFVICGGGSLSEQHHDPFRRRGITVLGAYGMTESAAAAAINRPATNRLGSVGRPNPGVSITVDDGELVLTGGNVSPGYWGEVDPERCGPGPFSVRTGDCGVVDDSGFVWITGRRKDILVTSSGKNVAPAPLEDRLRADPLITQCIVVGDQRPYVTALIAVDTAEVDRRQLSDTELHTAVQSAVDAANTSVSRAESIRRFRLVTTEFSISSGQLTASGKLVRAKILADHTSEIEALYS